MESIHTREMAGGSLIGAVLVVVMANARVIIAPDLAR